MTAPYDRRSVEGILADLNQRIEILEAGPSDLLFACCQLGSITIPSAFGAGFLNVGASGIYTNDSSFFQEEAGYIKVPQGGAYLVLAGARPAISTDAMNVEVVQEQNYAPLNTWGARQAVTLGQWRDIAATPLNTPYRTIGIWFRNLETNYSAFRFNVYVRNLSGLTNRTIDGGGFLLVRLSNVPYGFGGIGVESGTFA